MHEASLAEGLLSLITESVTTHNASHPEESAGRVTSLKLSLGLLSCIEIETFKGCFELLAEGTIAEKAKIEIEREALPCQCKECGLAFELRERRFVCPRCGKDRLSFTGGHGLVLLSLEVEKKENSYETT